MVDELLFPVDRAELAAVDMVDPIGALSADPERCQAAWEAEWAAHSHLPPDQRFEAMLSKGRSLRRLKGHRGYERTLD